MPGTTRVLRARRSNAPTGDSCPHVAHRVCRGASRQRLVLRRFGRRGGVMGMRPPQSIESIHRRHSMNAAIAKLKTWWQSRSAKPKV